MKPFLLIAFILSGLAGQAQQVRIDYKNTRLGQVFLDWGTRLGMEIYYSPSQIDTNELVTYSASGTAQVVVSALLEQYYFDHTVTGKQVAIRGYRHESSISGFVRERESGEDLPFANLFVRKLSLATNSNAYGFFSLEAGDSCVLEVSYAGYQTVYVPISKRGRHRIIVEMESHNDLQEVLVQESREEEQLRSGAGSFRLDPSDLEQLPSVGNEKDLVRAVQMLPGVQKGSDASNGMMVRGGEADQNLVIIDDAPIYNTSHLLGLFSVFSADAVKSAELNKSGFSSRHGGRLSSVLDVRTREGNRNKLSGSASVGTVASRVSLEGPLMKKKASFYVTARRSNLDWISMDVIDGESSMKVSYVFYDVNAKVNTDLGPKRKLYASLYLGSDRFGLHQQDVEQTSSMDVSWRNRVASARLNRVFSDKMFANLTLTYSRYHFSNGQNSLIPYISNQDVKTVLTSTIEDLSLRYDLDIFHFKNHQVKTGFQVIRHRFLPDYFRRESNKGVEELNSSSFDNYEPALYAETLWKPRLKLDLNAGFRFSRFLDSNFRYYTPEPRLALTWRQSAKHEFNFSYDRMAQYIRMLGQNNMGIPIYIWLPAARDFGPAVSDQLSASHYWKVKKWLALSSELYFKNTRRQVYYNPNFPLLSLFIPSQSPGSARAHAMHVQTYGVEWLAEGGQDKFSYMVSWVISYGRMKNPAFNANQWFDAFNDRRNDGAIWLNYKLSTRWSASLAWVFSSGGPITLPAGQYTLYTDPSLINGMNDPFRGIQGSYTVNDFERWSNYRQSDYHRLDISFRYSVTKKKLSHHAELGLFNVYNRANPFFATIEPTDYGTYVLKEISLFPVIPSLSYQIKW